MTLDTIKKRLFIMENAQENTMLSISMGDITSDIKTLIQALERAMEVLKEYELIRINHHGFYAKETLEDIQKLLGE